MRNVSGITVLIMVDQIIFPLAFILGSTIWRYWHYWANLSVGRKYNDDPNKNPDSNSHCKISSMKFFPWRSFWGTSYFILGKSQYIGGKYDDIKLTSRGGPHMRMIPMRILIQIHTAKETCFATENGINLYPPKPGLRHCCLQSWNRLHSHDPALICIFSVA